MSWAVFWIDPTQVSSQISVSVTAILTLIAYRFALGNLLPRISYLTRLDYLLLGSTILVFLALVEVTATSRLVVLGKESLARTLDKWARIVFPAAFVAVLVFSIFL